MSGWKILLLTPLVVPSGNFTTMSRIRCHIEKHGVECEMASPDDFSGSESLTEFIRHHNVSLVIAIHAYRAGRVVAGCHVPYILMLGGTDMNECSLVPDRLAVMERAVNSARHVIAFNESLMTKLYELWPNYSREKTSVIAQAIQVAPSNFSINEYLKDKLQLPIYAGAKCDHNQNINNPVQGEEEGKKSHDLSEQPQDQLKQSHDQLMLSHDQLTQSHDQLTQSHDQLPVSHDQHRKHSSVKLFTVVGGIRPVKNPLYLIKAFSEWHQRMNVNCILLFVGPKMDEEYYVRFQEAVASSPGVHHIPELSTNDTHAAIRDSFVLVNSSKSEGMAAAILEAMSLKTPVLVRGIQGNRSIVDDGVTGLVFDTVEEFLLKAEQLLTDADLVETLTQNASCYVTQQHSLKVEETAYLSVINQVLENPTEPLAC